MSDELRLNHFFTILRERRKAFAENYDYFAPKLAPRFNLFDFIRPDEMRLSEILATLLNPNGDHAQGDLFLKLFFSVIDIPLPVDWENIETGCEILTSLIENSSRRIDIEINFNNRFGLAIENKPWAPDQKGQLSDYARQMERKYGEDRWCLVYLSGNDSNPNGNSASSAQLQAWAEKNQYQQINFGQIVLWLTQCEAQCQSDAVRHFLRDFIGYCKRTFLGESDVVDANLVKEFALKKENLELALVVGQQMVGIKEELLRKLISDLKTQSNVALPAWDFRPDEDFNYWTRRKPLQFQKSSWTNYALAIRFDKTQCIGLYWGILRKNPKVRDLPEGTQKYLNDKLKKPGFINPWCSWGCSFNSPYFDWFKNIEPWIDIQSGEMAKMIVKEIAELAGIAADIIDEAERQIQCGE
jgi:hypothetical protein